MHLCLGTYLQETTSVQKKCLALDPTLSFSVLFKGEPLTLVCFCLFRIAVHHAKVKPLKRGVLNMLKRLDKIRFRGQKRDDFLDLAESPNGSDNECSDDILLRTKPSLKTQDTEELGDPVSIHST